LTFFENDLTWLAICLEISSQVKSKNVCRIKILCTSVLVSNLRI
jgi:hypothetical protein